jgi:hypothetical protein
MMKPLSAVTAPILAQLYVDGAQRTDAATAELRRMADENNRTVDRLQAEHPLKSRKATA